MRLLIDTDFFCKLAVGELLTEALRLLDVQLSDCGRLPALPHMLRRGSLPDLYGKEVCDQIAPIAESLPIIDSENETWLDRLTQIPAIDPGEALIFAAAAEEGSLVATGDKHALTALKDVAEYTIALEGRIIILEAIMIRLCDELGPDQIRKRVYAAVTMDKMLRACFSEGNDDPRAALLSYYHDSVETLDPLILWDPLEER